MRDHPQDLGLFAYGDTTGQGLAPRHSCNPVAVAFRALWDGARVRDFWLISGRYFACGASTMGLIGTHLIPACVDHGLTEVTAAGLLAATGVFAVIGGTASGWLSDRFDNRYLLFWYYGLRGVSLLYLPFAFNMKRIWLLIAGRSQGAALGNLGADRHRHGLDRMRAAAGARTAAADRGTGRITQAAALPAALVGHR
jgi:MFS family permease